MTNSSKLSSLRSKSTSRFKAAISNLLSGDTEVELKPSTSGTLVSGTDGKGPPDDVEVAAAAAAAKETESSAGGGEAVGDVDENCCNPASYLSIELRKGCKCALCKVLHTYPYIIADEYFCTAFQGSIHL